MLTHDRLLGGAILVVALALRWRLLGAAPYGDEAAHYSMAQTLGFLDRSIYWRGPDEPFQLYPLVLGRPLFALLHAPGAAFGFTAFRALGIVYASLVPVALFAVVRAAQGSRWFAGAAALVAAIHPMFVVWGGRVFPDHAMAALALAALAAFLMDRLRWAAGLVLAACLVKESALPLAFALAGWATWPRIRPSPHALQAPARARVDGLVALWVAVALGALPVVAGYLQSSRLPGWVFGGPFASALEGMVLSSWLLVTAAGAFAVPRARPIALCVAAVLAFYIVYNVWHGGTIQGWYMVLPAALVLAATASTLDAGSKSLRWPRPAAIVFAGGAALLMVMSVAGVAAPASRIIHPSADLGTPGLFPLIDFARNENQDFASALEFHIAHDPDVVLELDLAWYWIYYPFAGDERTVFMYTVMVEDVPVRVLGQDAETSDLVWLQDWNTSFHQAFQEVYADCELFEVNVLHAYDARACAGRVDRLVQAEARYAAAAV